ncbi:hypothetical protein M433DRAFT_156749 [Acidomyces richmondensis BFW]|nr:MAG: hypothetical protein FE78DRAFT_93704 [Acidomyces sp. 'richmondensis']KYG43433.1 hypothetical protein M433DRAFT_156749 [Acidomyces richmondensis BFW]
MPLPNRVQISQNESSIMLGTISAAAKAYNVSKSTVFRRIHRRSLREHFTPTNKKLSKTEEEGTY